MIDINATSPRWVSRAAARLRRVLARERASQPAQVTVPDLTRFAETFADLDDPDVMDRAWR